MTLLDVYKLRKIQEYCENKEIESLKWLIGTQYVFQPLKVVDLNKSKEQKSQKFHQNKGGNNMKTEFYGDYNIAAISFPGTYKVYYFVTYEDLAVGDHVVCDTARGYSVGVVKNVWDRTTAALNQNDIDISNITKEVVCKIDLNAFLQRKENRRKKSLIRQQLKQAVAENDELVLFASIAEHNPTVKRLLDEFNSLG